MKKFLAMLLALVMALSLVACGNTEQPGDNQGADDAASTDPFYIWTWNTDYQKILDEVLPKYLSEDQVSRIQIVNVGDSNIYQDKIDAILADPSNEQYPDIMLLEVGYVQKYVQSGQLMKAADLGITADDMSNMYDYNLKLGSDANGDAYALFWQATPGCWQIRTDLAEKYLGTTDPAALQDMLSTWDKVVEVSQSVNQQSGGKVKLLSGADDLKYVFCNGARTSAWYDADDNIVIDDAVKTYFELSKKLEGLTFDTKMWSTDWAALKDGDGEDYVKMILRAPGAPVCDIEISSAFGFGGKDTYQVHGTRGCLTGTDNGLKWKYYVDEEAPEQHLTTTPLRTEDCTPIYGGEELPMHEEAWTPNAEEARTFNSKGLNYYNALYDTLTTGAPFLIKNDEILLQLKITEEAYRQNADMFK